MLCAVSRKIDPQRHENHETSFPAEPNRAGFINRLQPIEPKAKRLEKLIAVEGDALIGPGLVNERDAKLLVRAICRFLVEYSGCATVEPQTNRPIAEFLSRKLGDSLRNRA